MNSSVRVGSLGPVTRRRTLGVARRDGVPDRQRGAIIVVQVTPAAASEVAA